MKLAFVLCLNVTLMPILTTFPHGLVAVLMNTHHYVRPFLNHQISHEEEMEEEERKEQIRLKNRSRDGSEWRRGNEEVKPASIFRRGPFLHLKHFFFGNGD